MGVVPHGAGPGVENGEDGQLTADILGIAAEFHKRPGRRAHEDGVELLLVFTHNAPQPLRQCAGDMEVWYGKEFLSPLVQPSARIRGMAFGAAFVLAGVIRVKAMTAVAVVALPKMTTQRLGAAGCDGFERALVTWRHPVAELIQILRTVYSYNLRQFDHGLKVGHEFVQTLVEPVANSFGKMEIDSGGGDVGVAEDFLKGGDILAVFQKVGGV